MVVPQKLKLRCPENATDALESEWFSGSLKLQLVDVAQAYEHNIQFPTYSKPLSINDWSLLNPRAFVPKPIPLAGFDDISAALVVDEYIVHNDKDLQVSLVVSGATSGLGITNTELTLGDNDKGFKGSEDKANADQLVFRFEVPSTALKDLSQEEVPLKAKINFRSGDESLVSTVIKVVGTDAILSSVNDAYIDGPHLIIPIEFEVNISGHYRFQANLFDEKTGDPVSHLSDTFKLSSLNNDAEVKVHSVTLKAKGSAGPYVLRDINVTRAPAKPGEKTGYGSTEESEYVVNGFELDRYSDELYINEKNQRRLEFLRRMAGHTSP